MSEPEVMVVPGRFPKLVVVLFGPKVMMTPELLVEIVPAMAPFGKVLLEPGGVEFTLTVRSKPLTFTFVPVPVVTILPKLMILGVATLLPEPRL